jgi:outer membrane protein assembly factor BamD (BamD/ComL family)
MKSNFMVLTLALVALLSACAPTSQELAQSFYEAGKRYYDRGDYNNALANYKESLKFSAYYKNFIIEVLNKLGDSYCSKGHYDSAFANYSEALNYSGDIKSKNRSNCYYKEGSVYYSKGDYDNAIKSYDSAFKDYVDASDCSSKTGLAIIYNSRGITHYHKGNYDQAIIDFSEAISNYTYTKNERSRGYSYQCNENNKVYLNNRGDAYYNKGDYDRAIKDYNSVLQIDPNYSYAQNGLKMTKDAQAKERAEFLKKYPPAVVVFYAVNGSDLHHFMSLFISNDQFIVSERNSVFLSKVTAEASKSRNGSVNEKQIIKLGNIEGARFVCVVVDGDGYSTARLIDVKNGQTIATGASRSYSDVFENIMEDYNNWLQK